MSLATSSGLGCPGSRRGNLPCQRVATDRTRTLSSPPNTANRRSLSWGRLEEPLVAQPVDAAPGPGRAGMIDFPHAEVVGGPRIDVQLGGDAGALQGQVHEHAVFRRADDVGPAVRE